jgi:L-threonylcarbamoyladenylate synthase
MHKLLTNKIAKILKKDGIGVMPTDTIYGLVGSAYSKKAVEKIYNIKDRPKNSPLIVLISSVSDLEKFGISKQTLRSQKVSTFLNKVWPGKVSVILDSPSSKFKHIHRGVKAIAFRFPNKKSLIEILKKTGPLVAPSANPSGLPPAKNIKEAKKYFGSRADFYMAGGTLESNPSTLVKINKRGDIEVLRGILKI